MSLLVQHALSSETRRYRFSVWACVNAAAGPLLRNVPQWQIALASEQRAAQHTKKRTSEREPVYESRTQRYRSVLLSLVFTWPTGKELMLQFIGICNVHALIRDFAAKLGSSIFIAISLRRFVSTIL